ITMEACLRALEAFISPSAATTCKVRESLGVDTALGLTLALVSRAASASAAMALCMATGILTSLISTRATLIPHCSVTLSRIALGANTQPITKSTMWAERKPCHEPCCLNRRKVSVQTCPTERRSPPGALLSNVVCIQQVPQPMELADQHQWLLCGFSTAS
uniref:Uncharacterized protein n=1 Tax=Strigops habroptila TaxID=2489341 RepID=A0A672TQF6_STRHB